MVVYAGQVHLVEKSTHYDEPVRGYFLQLVSDLLSSTMPVSLWITVSPGGSEPIGLPDLVSQVDAYDSRIVFVSFGQLP